MYVTAAVLTARCMSAGGLLVPELAAEEHGSAQRERRGTAAELTGRLPQDDLERWSVDVEVTSSLPTDIIISVSNHLVSGRKITRTYRMCFQLRSSVCSAEIVSVFS